MTRLQQLFVLGTVGVLYLWTTPAEQPALPYTGWAMHDYRRRWQRWTRKIGLR